MSMLRLIFRGVAIAGIAFAGLAASSVSFEWVPAPARFASHALAAVATVGNVIETEPIAEPASLAGVSWEGEAPEAAWVRGRADGGGWGDWVPLGLSADHGPDSGGAESESELPASDPAFLGHVSHVQFRIQPAAVDGTLVPQSLDRFTAELVDTSGRHLGLRQHAVRFLRSIRLNANERADGSTGVPQIEPREAWGGDECLTGTEPVPGKVHRVDVMFVHHAGTNDYSAGQDARDLIYGHCVYHVHTRGWWDVAYNFYVDRYGVIYEGRRGGVDEPIQGGHTRGFNSYSTGVAMLGNHSEGPVTEAAQDALVELATWKLDLSNTEPSGKVRLMSLGSSRYEAGTVVELNRMAGHRDASTTACPGEHCYSLLPEVRSRTDASGGAKIYADFQEFDPQDGSPHVHPAGPLRLEFTESTQWTMEILRRGGGVVFSTQGEGRDAVVFWNGTDGKSLVPDGSYEVVVRAGTARPVVQSFEIRTPDVSTPMVIPPGMSRWWGEDRYATAVAVSRHAFPGGTRNAFVATGQNFPDALATTPLAHLMDGPVLLTRTSSVPAVTTAELTRLRPERIYVLGGPAAVSDGVVARLERMAPVTRVFGRDRYETAVEISKRAYPDGAEVAYVAIGSNFPDALAGAPAAASQNGPLLLTRGGSLSSVTRNELRRLSPEQIVVLGSGTVIRDAVVSDLAALGAEVVPIGAPSRYSSAVAVSQHTHPTGSDTVLIATGAAFPDGLAGGPPASSAGAPVLLVPRTFLPASVAAELRRLDPSGIVILGGPGAVADDVENEIARISSWPGLAQPGS